MNDNISMIFCTCDSYNDTWHPFFTLLEKYWPDYNIPIFFNSESKNFSFNNLTINCPLAKQQNSKNISWSKRLLKVLKHIDSEFVLLMLDDFWLTDFVDIKQFNYCVDIMKHNNKIGFICLAADKNDKMLNDGTDSITLCEYAGLYEASTKCAYRVTTQVGLWRTKYLKKLLKGYEDAWRFEYWASRRSKFFSYRCLDVINPVIKYPFGGIVWGGKLKEDYFNLYPHELLHESLKKRPVLKIGEKYQPIFLSRPLWQKICSTFPSIRFN